MSTTPLRIRDLGRIPYPDAHDLQLSTRALRRAGTVPDTLLLCEHDPVYTAGRKTDASHVADSGVSVVSVERGGSVTYHGPGQIVGYPIADLRPRNRDVRGFLRGLEAAIVAGLAEFGIEARPGPDQAGVWIGNQKIASIGIAVRHWITYHGFALNVATDLAPFRRIAPCGHRAEVMTSLDRLLSPAPTVAEVRAQLIEKLLERFGWVRDENSEQTAPHGESEPGNRR